MFNDDLTKFVDIERTTTPTPLTTADPPPASADPAPEQPPLADAA